MCYGEISTDGKLVVKYQYMNCMQDNKIWYLEKSPQQNKMIVPTRTILHPCLDVTTFNEVKKSNIYMQ